MSEPPLGGSDECENSSINTEPNWDLIINIGGNNDCIQVY